jgi:hypothetical protein
MEQNVGKNDKIVRYILALISVYFAYAYSWWILIITIILVATAAIGFCGLYKLIGINTCKVKITKNNNKKKK